MKAVNIRIGSTKDRLKRGGTVFDYYKIAINTRNFEINLFWKRSLFFAGFVSAVFAGYKGAPENSLLQTMLAWMGLLLSICWYLANKGSKYWYESWEKKVIYLEKQLGANLFRCWSIPHNTGCILFHGSFRSVSKLAIAVSFFIIITWAFIILRSLAIPIYKQLAITALHAGSVTIRDMGHLLINGVFFMLLFILGLFRSWWQVGA